MGFEPRDGKMDDIDSRLGWNPKDRNPFLISNPFPTSIPCAKVTTLMSNNESFQSDVIEFEPVVVVLRVRWERDREREGGRERERERMLKEECV